MAIMQAISPVPDQVPPPVRAMMAASQSMVAMGLPLLVPCSMNLPVKAPQVSPAVAWMARAVRRPSLSPRSCVAALRGLGRLG
jgi:hypothetical protein